MTNDVRLDYTVAGNDRDVVYSQVAVFMETSV